jgi:hypothetical protein
VATEFRVWYVFVCFTYLFVCLTYLPKIRCQRIILICKKEFISVCNL